MQYDLVIIGGGPAGTAAGVYAARKKLRTALIASEFGGQSKVSFDVQNWIGTPSISGTDLAANLKKHVETYALDVLSIREGERTTAIEKTGKGFLVKTDAGIYDAKMVLVTSGSDRRKLAVAGADRLEGKGIVYCASCDGPLFAGKDTAVIGGGNAGFETAAQLLAYAKSVTLLEYADTFKAEQITIKKVLENPKMRAISGVEIKEVRGEKFVESLVYRDRKTGEEKELPTGGIFVEIGQIPNTGFVKGLLELNQFGQVKIDPRTQRTSMEGIWAAGDCTDVLYHQNNIAAGDAVRALEDIYLYLHAK